jgi:Putative transposase
MSGGQAPRDICAVPPVPQDNAPFAGPKAVLAYLSRYIHRVAISNARLIAADTNTVTFKVKDYRVEGPARYTTMSLVPAEFIRRFMLHCPKAFTASATMGYWPEVPPRHQHSLAFER